MFLLIVSRMLLGSGSWGLWWRVVRFVDNGAHDVCMSEDELSVFPRREYAQLLELQLESKTILKARDPPEKQLDVESLGHEFFDV